MFTYKSSKSVQNFFIEFLKIKICFKFYAKQVLITEGVIKLDYFSLTGS